MMAELVYNVLGICIIVGTVSITLVLVYAFYKIISDL